jgi:hypothetical protein
MTYRRTAAIIAPVNADRNRQFQTIFVIFCASISWFAVTLLTPRCRINFLPRLPSARELQRTAERRRFNFLA